MAVAAVELLREMDHFPAVGRIDPAVSDDKPVVSHRTCEKWLIRD